MIEYSRTPETNSTPLSFDAVKKALGGEAPFAIMQDPWYVGTYRGVRQDRVSVRIQYGPLERFHPEGSMGHDLTRDIEFFLQEQQGTYICTAVAINEDISQAQRQKMNGLVKKWNIAIARDERSTRVIGLQFTPKEQS